MAITPSDFEDMLDKTGPPCDVWEIEFQGGKYLFIGERDVDGAIATKEQFDNFRDSYAHLHKDGIVHQYGKRIGTKDEITYHRKVK